MEAEWRVGRPSSFSEGLADIICLRIAEGDSLRKICAEEGMPSQSMVFRWLAQSGEFRERYAHARESQADKLAEEILEIADDGKSDTYTDEDGNVRTDHDVVARSRLRVDARKWLASKMAPKKYGDRTTLAGDAENPVALLTLDQISANPNSRLKVK